MRKFLSGNTDINLKISLLEKISKKWIPKMITENLKNHKKCNICQKYSLERDFSIESILENEERGYDTDEKSNPQTYCLERVMVKYSICPLCKGKNVEEKRWWGTIWTKSREEYLNDKRWEKLRKLEELEINK